MYRSLFTYLLFILFVTGSFRVFGGIETPKTAYLYGYEFIQYTYPVGVQNPNYIPNPNFINELSDFIKNSSPYAFPQNQRIRKIQNMLQLYLDPNLITYIGFAYELVVEVEIKKYAYGATASTSEIIKLKINYDPEERSKWVEKANYHFMDCGSVEYKVLSITLNHPAQSSLPPQPLTDEKRSLVASVVGLRSDIIIERYYDFDPNTPLSGNQINHIYNGNLNELTILWSPLQEAEYFDLEWTFVDDYDGIGGKIPASNLQYDKHFNLSRNATRVQVTEAFYTFPVIFESGYILYRVRMVGMKYEASTDIIYPMVGAWSTDIAPDVAAWPHTFQITAPFEQDKFNWQIITSYAEEGKRKSIIGFRDGTQRNHQTVTGLSSEEKAMVAEQIYDYQGRAAIEVLPVPTKDAKLKYYPLFNIRMPGNSYNKSNFDRTTFPTLGSSDCEALADPMHPDKGASNYYSSYNPDKTGMDAFIPDAGFYPFVHTQFTPDNTGRISRQSGVGKDHKIGSGHETKYFYGTPVQEELSSLFGSEVGYADHYKKNVVQDPNKQLSVSFLNLKGNVIATALAGNPPANLDTLPSYDPYFMDVDLMVFNQVDSMANELVASKSFTVTTASDYSFSYTLSHMAFEAAMCETLKLCFDCVYDLEVMVIDNLNCDKVKYHEVKTLNPIFYDKYGYLIYDACPKGTTNFVLDSSISLEVGSYTVTKRLKVNQAATDAYVAHYMKLFQDTCDVYDNFLQQFLSQVDSSMCDLKDSTKALNRCEIAREAMLSDMSPGGQYGQIDWVSYSSSDPLSVFNASNTLPESNAHWKNSTIAYKNEDGISVLFKNALGNWVHHSDPSISLEDFLESWEPSFANTLLRFHPEYCYYEWCIADSEAFDFDATLDTVVTYEDAVGRGIFSFSNPGIIISVDPYFLPGAGWVSQIAPWTSSMTPVTKMSAALNLDYYEGNNSSAYTMLQLAVLTSLAKWQNPVWPNHSPVVPTISDVNYWIASQSTSSPQLSILRDSVWINFRSMYLAKKEELQYKDRTHYAIYDCGNKGGYNECIDTSFFNWYRNGYGFGYGLFGSGRFNTTSQACSWTTFWHYSDKSIRFPSMYNLPIRFDPYGKPQDVHDGLEGWAAGIKGSLCDTCLCNKAFTDFVKWIIDQKDYLPPISTTPVNLPPLGFTTKIQNLFQGCTGVPVTDMRYQLNGSTISIQFSDVNNVYGGQLSLHIPNGSILNWEYADSISCINYMGIINNNHTGGGTVYTTLQQSHPVEITFRPNCKLWMDCGNSNTQCPPTPEGLGLAQLINRLISNGKVDQTMSINASEVPIGLYAYYNPITSLQTNLTWNGQISGSNINGILSSVTKECRFVLEFPTGTSLPGILPSLGAVISFKPDTGLGNTTSGYSYSGVLEVLVPATNQTILIKVKCNCFPLSFCGKCPPVPQAEIKMRNQQEKPNEQKEGKNARKESQNRTPIPAPPISGIDKPCLPCDSSKYIISYDSLASPGKPVLVNTQLKPKICDPCHPAFDTFPTIPIPNPCLDEQVAAAYANAANAYQNYLDSLERSIRQAYIRHCLLAQETFRKQYTDALHHFTLYYYDQAGNLLKTIPPEGVHRLSVVQTQQAIAHMNGSSGVNAVAPPHEMPSDYHFNSLNQLRKQTIPDHDGESEFFYDYLSRIVISQNPEQRNNNRYSYTLYDKLNRPYETGELINVATLMTPAIAKNETQLLAWIGSNTKQEVTTTKYDEPLQSGNPVFNGRDGHYRDRIASITYKEITGGSNVVNSTYYLYDIHGNVKELVQDIYQLGKKRMSYDYDLISGNVNNVYYQKGEVDQFLHRYQYDADNRITNVFTSFDGKVWDQDAQYFYYAHGPLARTELGENKVQGLDYAYTIQGWIKGVNSGVLNPNVDIGNDGVQGHPHGTVAEDAFGYMLRYFTDDYKMIGQALSSAGWEPTYKNTNFWRQNRDLFNGNIQSMITAITEPINSGMQISPLGYGYNYDQLNRITGMTAYEKVDKNNNIWPLAGNITDYATTYTYDANGNIDILKRNGVGTQMDNFKYNYLQVNGKRSNRLGWVDDDLSLSSNYPDDIDDQNPGNYSYDAIGNLKQDLSENMDIYWNGAGKVSHIKKSGTQEAIDFDYDPTGKRVIKRIRNLLTQIGKSTYYVLDATGNVMAIYTREERPLIRTDFNWESAFVYGSSRIGEDRIDTSIVALASMQNRQNNTWNSYRDRGSKYFELGNHLGNVLTTVSDRSLHSDSDGNGGVDGYVADVWTVNDYYPFGSPIAKRSFESEKFRYGFNSHEKVNEISGKGNHNTALFGELNTRLGNRWNLDPKANPEISTYAVFGNNPIFYIDIALDTPMIYGTAEVRGTTLTDKGGVADNASAAIMHRDVKLVPAYNNNGGLVGYHVFDTKDKDRQDYPIMQFEVGDEKAFLKNYDILMAGARMYYSNGEPSDGMKKYAAAFDWENGKVNWNLASKGLASQWMDYLTDPMTYLPAPTISRASVKTIKGTVAGYNNYVSKNKLPQGSHKGQGKGSASITYSKGYKASLEKQTDDFLDKINLFIEASYEGVTSIFD